MSCESKCRKCMMCVCKYFIYKTGLGFTLTTTGLCSVLCSLVSFSPTQKLVLEVFPSLTPYSSVLSTAKYLEVLRSTVHSRNH